MVFRSQKAGKYVGAYELRTFLNGFMMVYNDQAMVTDQQMMTT